MKLEKWMVEKGFTTETVFKVLEITPEFREKGKFLREFRTREAAERFMKKSIFRFMREEEKVLAPGFKRGISA